MFITWMWFSENERLGFKACTRVGYTLRGIATLVGLVGLLLLLAAPPLVVWQLVAGTFRPSHLWLFAVAVGVGVFSKVLESAGWALAQRRGFHYDYEPDVASWAEAGTRRTLGGQPRPGNAQPR